MTEESRIATFVLEEDVDHLRDICLLSWNNLLHLHRTRHMVLLLLGKSNCQLPVNLILLLAQLHFIPITFLQLLIQRNEQIPTRSPSKKPIPLLTLSLIFTPLFIPKFTPFLNFFLARPHIVLIPLPHQILHPVDAADPRRRIVLLYCTTFCLFCFF